MMRGERQKHKKSLNLLEGRNNYLLSSVLLASGENVVIIPPNYTQVTGKALSTWYLIRFGLALVSGTENNKKTLLF